jgi:DNA invertase Pin-like site-specific DNA recombinase
MLIGYARVSTGDQTLDLQVDALKARGCEKIYTDAGVSGSKASRPELDKALADLRSGDTLVVWRLDRLGRSLAHLVEVVNGLGDRGVGFTSLRETIDTGTPTGKLMFHLMASLAEFERDLIRERTNAGLASARARGRVGGRPKSLSEAQIKMGQVLAQDVSLTVPEICKQLGISRATYYREIAKKTG